MRVLIRKILFGSLAAALFAACGLAPWSVDARRGEAPTLMGANTAYTSGQMAVFAAMWARFIDPAFVEVQDRALVGGSAKRYWTNVSIAPTAFPDGWRIDWAVPDVGCTVALAGNPGVCGYLHAAHCNYNNGSVNPAGCTPRQVDAITTLESHYDVTSGGSGSSSGLHEAFLTGTAGDQSDPNKRAEIAVMLAPSSATVAYVSGGSAVGGGTWTDKFGRAWTVRSRPDGIAGLYLIAMCPGGCARLSGSFDWRGYMTFLKAAGAIQGSWWYNGMGMGTEPESGTGWMRLGRWRMIYN